MGTRENIAVFTDTKMLCESNEILIKSTQKSILDQCIVYEKDRIYDIDKQVNEAEAKVIVSRKRTYEAASFYEKEKVAVLNFANAYHPGGGVENGAKAQEECLCRCSNLFLCLSDKRMLNSFYTPHGKHRKPIGNDDIIYTPSVKVFKTDTQEPKLMDEKDWYEVDVITCAAPNLWQGKGYGVKTEKKSDEELLYIHEKRLNKILEVAVWKKVDTIILGAFGCGAFENDPEIVASAAKNVIANYMNAFKNIEFAIYCRPEDEGYNYNVFSRILTK